MKKNKTKEQLIIELAKLRQRVYELDTSETKKISDMSKLLTSYKIKISKLKDEILFLGKKEQN